MDVDEKNTITLPAGTYCVVVGVGVYDSMRAFCNNNVDVVIGNNLSKDFQKPFKDLPTFRDIEFSGKYKKGKR